MTQARTLNNRYELQAKIGDGGMATVYKAMDLRLNRVVAIKILRDSYSADPQFLERFKREAQQAASLNHPNIVRVFDVGDDGDMHYIVMEFVDGSSLKEIIVRSGPFTTQRALELGAEICDAIDYSHNSGLIHRDIKPQNILIDKGGRVKVTDFGIAKSTNASTLTEAGITLGTVHYFSPEQAKGLPVLPQSDIYSIGIVLFEMLTGQIPFDSDNAVALALKHIEEPPPPLRRFNPAVPLVVEQIVLRSLAKDPNRRYSNAAELARALRNVENQSEQGTRSVRPAAPIPPVAPTNGRSPVQPQTNYTNKSAEATNFQPVRPAQPSYPVYEQPDAYPYDRRTPQRNAVRYNNDRIAPNYRDRVPVVQPLDGYDEEPRRNAGCLPWIIGGAAFLMITALILAGLLILPSLTAPNPQKTATNPPPTLSNNTPVPVAKVAVPDVTKKTQPQAEDQLTKSNLKIGTVTQETSDQDANTIIRTDPKAGTQVDVNTPVNLVVSKGKIQVPLNDYVNRDPNASINQLKELGFQVQRSDEFSPDFPENTVIRTDPKGGSGVSVAKGSLIKVVVSKGPQPTATPLAPTATPAPPTATPVPPTPTPKPVVVNVPQVVGERQADGEKALRDAGLQPQVVVWDEAELRRQFSGAALDQALNTFKSLKSGEILGTNPPGGSPANKGSQVIVAVKK